MEGHGPHEQECDRNDLDPALHHDLEFLPVAVNGHQQSGQAGADDRLDVLQQRRFILRESADGRRLCRHSADGRLLSDLQKADHQRRRPRWY